MKTKVYLIKNKGNVVAVSMDEQHAYLLRSKINGDAGFWGDGSVEELPLDEYVQHRNYIVHYEFTMKPKVSLNLDVLYESTRETVVELCRHNYLVYVTAPDELRAKLKADKLLAERKLLELTNKGFEE